MLNQLRQSDAFSGYFTFSSINWFHLAIPVHYIFWLLLLKIIEQAVKGENIEIQSGNIVGQKKKMQYISPTKVGTAAIAIPDSDRASLAA